MVSLTLMAACAAAAVGNGNKKQATAAARKGTLAEVSGMRIMGSLLSLVARRAARSIPGVAGGWAQSCSHAMSAVLACQELDTSSGNGAAVGGGSERGHEMGWGLVTTASDRA